MPEFRQPTGQMYPRRSPRRPLGGVDERLYVALPLLAQPRHLEKYTLRVGGVSPIRQSFVGLVEGDDDRRKRWLRRMQAYGQRAQ